MYKEKLKNDFIEKSIKVHNYDYDYSLIDYINKNTRIEIYCKKCKDYFSQTPVKHLLGRGCSRCAGNIKKTNDEFEIELIKVHGNRYDYSNMIYNGAKKNIKIICKEHGEFEQMAYHHLKGSNCPICIDNKLKTTEYIIEKSNIVHNYEYDYSLSEYVNNRTNIKIICKEHGIFEQLPDNHINKKYGCPCCNESKGEKEIYKYLDKNNIEYIRQKKFKDCKNKKSLPFDFYLPEYNICIEYNGIQHYEHVGYFGCKEKFEYQLNNDRIKYDYCIENDIRLIIIKYDENILDRLNLE